MLETHVYFEFDKSELSDSAKDELNNAAAWASLKPDAKLVIEGHADEAGDEAYNKKLSERRAKATKEYLMSLGLAYRIEGLVIDVRGTARAAFDDEMFDGVMTDETSNSLDNWSASAQLGYEF